MRNKVLINLDHSDNQSRICGICFLPMKMQRVRIWNDGDFRTEWKPSNRRSAYDARQPDVLKVIEEAYGSDYPLSNKYHDFYGNLEKKEFG